MSATDELLLRTGLPQEYRWLEAAVPRATWPRLRLHATAEHWLQVHAWFRATQASLNGIGTSWLEGGIDTATLHRTMLPRLREFLGHLDAHHHIESDSYFPAFATAEPRMRRGFELLDRDHETVDAMLAAIAADARRLHMAIAAAEADPRAAAEALVQTAAATLLPLTRHLDDEEDIVIPLLTLQGDPLRG